MNWNTARVELVNKRTGNKITLETKNKDDYDKIASLTRPSQESIPKEMTTICNIVFECPSDWMLIESNFNY